MVEVFQNITSKEMDMRFRCRLNNYKNLNCNREEWLKRFNNNKNRLKNNETNSKENITS